MVTDSKLVLQTIMNRLKITAEEFEKVNTRT